MCSANSAAGPGESWGVTVVVPTLNRGGFLLDCLRDLIAQAHRPLEILVVDQSAMVVPEVERLVRGSEDLISYHRVSFRGLPQARNYGWQHARYEAIVFVDDDVRCGPQLVSQHLRTLSQPAVGLVAGGIDELNKPADAGPPTGVFSWWGANPIRGFGAVGEAEVDHVPGGNFAALRSVLREVGGVDEALSRGASLYEETDLSLRVRAAGYRIVFNGHARLSHLAAPSGGCRMEEVRPYVWSLARNRGVMIRRHLRWFHRPTALARVLQLGVAHARHYRVYQAALDAVGGCIVGLVAGGRPPRCTRFAEGEVL